MWRCGRSLKLEWTDMEPICFADRQSILEYKLPAISLRCLPGVTDVGLWTTDQLDAAVAAELERLRAIIADDSYAMTFQTLGQYRAALLKAFAK